MQAIENYLEIGQRVFYLQPVPKLMTLLCCVKSGNLPFIWHSKFVDSIEVPQYALQ